jgi:hypothetical protein
VGDWLAPEYIPGLALEDSGGTVGRGVLNPVAGECIEHIMRMAMKSFRFAGFEPKLQNTNSIVLELNCQFLTLLRVNGTGLASRAPVTNAATTSAMLFFISFSFRHVSILDESAAKPRLCRSPGATEEGAASEEPPPRRLMLSGSKQGRVKT